MKKLLLTLCLVLCGAGASAQKFYEDTPESGDWAVGLNIPVTWGDDAHLGFGPKVQFYATSAFRLEGTFDYYFKAKSRIDWDVNFNLHYVFPLKDSGFQLYPVVGVTFLHRHYTGPVKPEDDKGRVGLNIGAGVQYDIASNIYVNAELKYVYLNDYDRANLSLGIAYRF